MLSTQARSKLKGMNSETKMPKVSTLPTRKLNTSRKTEHMVAIGLNYFLSPRVKLVYSEKGLVQME